MFNKDKFKQDLLEAFDPPKPPPHNTVHASPTIIGIAIFILMLLGWVTADIWAAVHAITNP